MVFVDTCEIRLPLLDDTAMRARDYFPCRPSEWHEAVRRLETNAARRMRRLPTRFHLATVNALRCWDASTHRVLRVEPTSQFPQGIVGLLMETS